MYKWLRVDKDTLSNQRILLREKIWKGQDDESLEERVRLYGKSLGLKVRETWIFILALSFTNLWLWANYITSLTLTFLIYKMGRMSVSQGYFGGLLFGLVITSLSMVIAS